MKFKELRNKILFFKKEILFAVVFLLISIWAIAISVPISFKTNTIIEIQEGDSLKNVSENLKNNNVINSTTAFNAILILQNKEKKIVTGEYFFPKKVTAFEVANRITNGDFGFAMKKITLKEGLTTKEMAFYLEQSLPNFDKKLFLEKVQVFEGHLFPDTYVFPENIRTDKVIEKLQSTFETKIKEIDNLISGNKRSLDEIIIMASIVEKEATAEARQEVANILWHRIEKDMPLQVDATFVYERGLGTFDLTKSDLKKDSPYNTYTNKGLPPTAISNPGIESIKAAANPQPTKNLYFLTGHDGNMYYAETFEGHKTNRIKHLN